MSDLIGIFLVSSGLVMGVWLAHYNVKSIIRVLDKWKEEKEKEKSDSA